MPTGYAAFTIHVAHMCVCVCVYVVLLDSPNLKHAASSPRATPLLRMSSLTAMLHMYSLNGALLGKGGGSRASGCASVRATVPTTCCVSVSSATRHTYCLDRSQRVSFRLQEWDTHTNTMRPMQLPLFKCARKASHVPERGLR